jgi:hypothetical protein
MTRPGRWCGMSVGLNLLAVMTAVVATVWPAETRLWTFSADPVGAVPRGWEVLSGRWEVRAEVPGTNRILVQAGPSLPGLDLPTILTPAAAAVDLEASVRVKATGMGTFETMGILLRWQNPKTMLSVRMDGTPRWIWVERVQDGRRSLRAGYSIDSLAPGSWHVLRVVARREWLNLFFNGRFLGGVRDDDPAPGRVGLVAGPDAAVLLDDVEIAASAGFGEAG